MSIRNWSIVGQLLILSIWSIGQSIRLQLSITNSMLILSVNVLVNGIDLKRREISEDELLIEDLSNLVDTDRDLSGSINRNSMKIYAENNSDLKMNHYDTTSSFYDDENPDSFHQNPDHKNDSHHYHHYSATNSQHNEGLRQHAMHDNLAHDNAVHHRYRPKRRLNSSSNALHVEAEMGQSHENSMSDRHFLHSTRKISTNQVSSRRKISNQERDIPVALSSHKLGGLQQRLDNEDLRDLIALGESRDSEENGKNEESEAGKFRFGKLLRRAPTVSFVVVLILFYNARKIWFIWLRDYLLEKPKTRNCRCKIPCGIMCDRCGGPSCGSTIELDLLDTCALEESKFHRGLIRCLDSYSCFRICCGKTSLLFGRYGIVSSLTCGFCCGNHAIFCNGHSFLTCFGRRLSEKLRLKKKNSSFEGESDHAHSRQSSVPIQNILKADEPGFVRFLLEFRFPVILGKGFDAAVNAIYSADDQMLESISRVTILEKFLELFCGEDEEL